MLERHVPITNPKLCYDELLIAYKVTWGSLYAELFSNLDLGQQDALWAIYTGGIILVSH